MAIDRIVRMALVLALAACQGGGSKPGGAERIPDPGGGAGVGAAGPSGSPSRAAALPRAVTLLTGHRVTVFDESRVSIDPPARGSALVHAYREGGRLYVVPADAEALVARGRLDRRLFDVTGLLELDYDDAHRADLPLLVTYPSGGAARAAAEAALAAAGAPVTRALLGRRRPWPTRRRRPVSPGAA
jgi:hypothetical protein